MDKSSPLIAKYLIFLGSKRNIVEIHGDHLLRPLRLLKWYKVFSTLKAYIKLLHLLLVSNNKSTRFGLSRRLHEEVWIMCQDDFERKTGNLLRTNLLLVGWNATKVSIFIIYVLLIIANLEINEMALVQLDGFPYSILAILSERLKLKITSFSARGNNIAIESRDSIRYERLPLTSDIEILRMRGEAFYADYARRSRLRIVEGNDTVYKTKNTPKEVSLNLLNKGKYGIILMHCFTDQSRFRLAESFFDSFLDWFAYTLKVCKRNKSLNWYIKDHPHQSNYRIDTLTKEYINSMITESGFKYFPSEDMSQTDLCNATVGITCNGSPVVDYTALYKIPIISCNSRYVPYIPEMTPNCCFTKDEYEATILNAHNLSVDSKQIEAARRLFYFYREAGSDINSENIVFTSSSLVRSYDCP